MRLALVLLPAHAFGKRYELPVPLLGFVLGGAAVVVVSFLLVLRLRMTAYQEPAAEDRGRATRVHPVWTVVSLVLLAAAVVVGITGSQVVAENILPTVFWLLIWIAVPVTCGVLGDWTQPLNAMGNLARLADRPGLRRALLGSPEPVAWPRWLGWWPAVLLFFLTACGELIFNLTLTIPENTAIALLAYAVLSTVCGLLFGRAWLERGEMFTVLYDTWGRLGYFRFGQAGRRAFAGGLDVPFSPAFSRIAFVLFLLISVNFDGLLATPRWAQLQRSFPGNIDLHPGRLHTFQTVSFVLLALAILVVFGAFAAAAARAGRHGTGFRTSLAGLLPSLLPIAFGYLVAHNIEYLLVNSQLMAPLIGNPVGKSSWPIHLPYPFNDSYEPTHTFLPTSFYWYFSVVVIVLVHVVAVFRAHRHLHDRGTDPRRALLSEYPWLVAMVGYTMLSLWLIAQPLTKGG